MKLINADCIAAMKDMPDNSVDSIVTDPPYELGFMGKSWDSTGIANSVEMWSEALRVLKPGGYLIAFSGSRTYHRMAVAIEDAGFEIRDQIMWVYGSGFPKSHNISKGIDKTLKAPRGEITGESNGKGYSSQQEKNLAEGFRPYKKGLPSEHADRNIYALSSDEAKQWDGWGTALKPAHEPIVLARKPLIDTVANNVLTHGTGGLNIDGCRVTAEDENFDNLKGRPITKLAIQRVGETDADHRARVLESPAQQEALAKLKELGRFPANFIHDGSDEVLALFPETGKSTGGRIGKKSMGNVTNVPAGEYEAGDPGYGDSGSAARFFYCAKTSKRDRNEGLEGFEEKLAPKGNSDGRNLENPSNHLGGLQSTKAQNYHPTVKPTDLMRYLCRLITPPNGTVLDPFMGSGSTGKAAILEGFDFIGIEQDAAYIEIAKARIAYVQS